MSLQDIERIIRNLKKNGPNKLFSSNYKNKILANVRRVKEEYRLTYEQAFVTASVTEKNEITLAAERFNELYREVRELIDKIKVAERREDVESEEDVGSEEYYESELEDLGSENKTLNGKDTLKMERFELRTAGHIIPVMTDTTDSVTQVIDAIELYSSMIEISSKSNLINFVLKTRLSAKAKLRLAKQYSTVECLVKDMRKHLIPKKSACSLAAQLAAARQDSMSIGDFGKKIEDLFVDLTIAQSEETDGAENILRIANEKNAIHVFANGLRETELRTVVKARNYQSLREAISGALDEEKVMPKQAHAYSFRGRARGGKNRGNWRSKGRYGNQSDGRGGYNNSSRGQGRERGREQGRSERGSYRQDNSSNNSRNRNRDNTQRVYVVEGQEENMTQTAQNNQESSSSSDHSFRD